MTIEVESEAAEAEIGIYPKYNIAAIYAKSKEMMKKFDTLCNEPGSSWELLDVIKYRSTGEIIGKYYICHIDLIKFKAKELENERA